jgi:hypothetical protein
MNKRQAKIEALYAAAGILQSSDIGTFLNLPDDADILKVWKEFEAIRDRLRDRADRLEGKKE